VGADQGSGKDPAVLSLWDLETDRHELFLTNATRGAWSPAGDQVAFLLFGTPRYGSSGEIVGGDVGTERHLAVHLGIVTVADRALRLLLPLGTVGPLGLDARGREDYRPQWSPGGDQLIARETAGDLLLVRSDGSERLRFGGREVEASWSPDGKHLGLTDNASRSVRIIEPL
jgi:hypothetical protein